ncbi:MAG: hypothetical protein RL653_3327 [Pseudomonadota bacterium]|jgi:hypothetical protein
MTATLRLTLSLLAAATLTHCQCGAPPVEEPCSPAMCAGCCVDGMCTFCPGPDAGELTDAGSSGGDAGAPDAGGQSTEDTGSPPPVDGGQPDAGTPDAGTPVQDAGTLPVSFDGGWVMPTLPRRPALVGDGGTTVVVAPGADPSAPTKFSGSVDPSAAPTVVYPPDGVMLPPNTNSIEFHFVPSSGQTLFKFTFVAPTTTLEVYTGCTAVGGGCVFTPDATFWSSLAAYARGTVPVKWTVSGVDGASPGSVGVSGQQGLSFTEQDLLGGLYYWNSAGSVVRFDYGFPNSPRQTYATSATVGASTCVGCHVLSRQGNLIAVGKDIPAPAQYSVLSVPTRQVASSSAGPLVGAANFFSFSPDEKHLLQSNGSKIEWRDLISGMVRPVTGLGTMPDWSPSGASMVYVKPPSALPFGFGSPGVQSGALQVMDFNGTGFNPPRVLVASQGQNNYYPTYSPDGEWIAFNRSPSNTESMTNATAADGGVPDGELWAIDAQGGTPVKLAQATAPGPCSWPKWAPVKHDYAFGQVMWLTFSSPRAYGLRLADWQRTQLWMVAFDPARMAQGQDPSFPAFWLPFQDMGSGNHIGQWTTEVPRAACTGTGQSNCSPGEICVNNRCRPG